MKKIKLFIFFIVLLFVLSPVYAHDLKKITMDIYIDQNGNANISEVWDIDVNEGTEIYKPYYNLGTSEIIDYKAYRNNIPYDTLSNWNTSASFEDKSYKAGINEISDGLELCMGISEYGDNSYKMEYTITNFVVGTNDYDMVYWTLIPHGLSDKPEYVYIKIHSDFEYEDTLDVWGYGNYGGYAYVYDGYIEMSNESGLNSDEYMTILIKFPKGLFNVSTIMDEDFEHFLNMAEGGAEHYTEDKVSIIETIFRIFMFMISFIVPFAALIIAAIYSHGDIGTKKIKFLKDAKKVKDAPYFRDIPFKNDLFKGYWISCQYGLIKNKTDFLGAMLLKWIKDGNVENTTVTSKVLKKEERAIKLITSDNLSEREKELFDMMLKASVDGILESNEFTSWCKRNYNKILKWFNNVIDDKTDEFVNEGTITEEKNAFGKRYIVDDRLKPAALEVAGLKNFLNEFSNISDRESIEVKLWEEYLIYAQIFGIAKKVAKEFKKLYPDVITDDMYNDIIFIHTISYQGVSAASSAKTRAESYSSGGGGFSSGGGGFGSFGGGGGGGGVR